MLNNDITKQLKNYKETVTEIKEMINEGMNSLEQCTEEMEKVKENLTDEIKEFNDLDNNNLDLEDTNDLDNNNLDLEDTNDLDNKSKDSIEIKEEKSKILEEIDEMEKYLDDKINNKDNKLTESEIIERMNMKYHLDEVDSYINKIEEKDRNSSKLYNKLIKRKESILDSMDLNRLNNILYYNKFSKLNYKNTKKKAIEKISTSDKSFPNVNLESSINSMLYNNPIDINIKVKKFLYGYYKFILDNKIDDNFEFIYFFSLNVKFFKTMGLDDDRLRLKNSIERIINNKIK